MASQVCFQKSSLNNQTANKSENIFEKKQTFTKSDESITISKQQQQKIDINNIKSNQLYLIDLESLLLQAIMTVLQLVQKFLTRF